MNWEVEYTDEFEDWWSSLTEEEQEEIAASVGLLRKWDRGFLTRIVQAFRAQSTVLCVSFGFNIRTDRTGFSMPSILGAWPCC
jgi:hypothetical protein